MNSFPFRVLVPTFSFSDPDKEVKMERFRQNLDRVKLLDGYIDMKVETSGYDCLIEFHFSYSNERLADATRVAIKEIFTEGQV